MEHAGMVVAAMGVRSMSRSCVQFPLEQWNT